MFPHLHIDGCSNFVQLLLLCFFSSLQVWRDQLCQRLLWKGGVVTAWQLCELLCVQQQLTGPSRMRQSSADIFLVLSGQAGSWRTTRRCCSFHSSRGSRFTRHRTGLCGLCWSCSRERVGLLHEDISLAKKVSNALRGSKNFGFFRHAIYSRGFKLVGRVLACVCLCEGHTQITHCSRFVGVFFDNLSKLWETLEV